MIKREIEGMRDFEEKGGRDWMSRDRNVKRIRR